MLNAFKIMASSPGPGNKNHFQLFATSMGYMKSIVDWITSSQLSSIPVIQALEIMLDAAGVCQMTQDGSLMPFVTHVFQQLKWAMNDMTKSVNTTGKPSSMLLWLVILQKITQEGKAASQCLTDENEIQLLISILKKNTNDLKMVQILLMIIFQLSSQFPETIVTYINNYQVRI